MVLVLQVRFFDIGTGGSKEENKQDRERGGTLFNDYPNMLLFPCSGHWYDGASFLSRQDVSVRDGSHGQRTIACNPLPMRLVQITTDLLKSLFYLGK